MSQPAVETIPTQLEEQLARCIRCGLCLPACPTYGVFRTEMDAPRGRLALMRAVWEDQAPGTAAEEHLDLCLGCLSCETACPSGVEYGSLLHATRRRMSETRGGGLGRAARRMALAALGRRRLLHVASHVLGLAQALGLVSLARRLPVPLLRRMAGLLPAPITRFRPSRPAAIAEARGRVALFRGCVQDAFLGSVHSATVRLLERAGWEVRLPAGQTCCGAAAHHADEGELARRLARRNLEAFEAGDCDYVVNNAGGCGAMLGDYGALFAGSGDEERARRFADRVRDLSELLAEGEAPLPTGSSACRATYADSCHLRHAQGVVAEPRALLGRLPGLDLVELARPDHCCGSAGIYNLTQGETADRLLARKLAEIRATGAEVVVTTNPGCQLQIAAGARREGLAVEVLHLAELLDRSHAASD